MLKHWWVKPSHTCLETGWQHVVTGEKCLVPDWLVSVCWRMFIVAGKSAPKPPVMLVSLIRDIPWQPQVSKKKCVFPKWFGSGSWQSQGEIYQKKLYKVLHHKPLCDWLTIAVELHGRHQLVLQTLNYSWCGSKSVRRPFTFTVNVVPCNIFQQAQRLLWR